MKKILLMIAIAGHCLLVNAQILNPVKWSYGAKRLSATEGVIFLKASMEDGWHIYSQTVPEGGPIKTSFNFPKSKNYALIGNTIEPKPINRFEKVFGFVVAYFEDSVIFQQRVKLNTKGRVNVSGSLMFQTCNDEKCIPPVEVPFSLTIN